MTHLLSGTLVQVAAALRSGNWSAIYANRLHHWQGPSHYHSLHCVMHYYASCIHSRQTQGQGLSKLVPHSMVPGTMVSEHLTTTTTALRHCVRLTGTTTTITTSGHIRTSGVVWGIRGSVWLLLAALLLLLLCPAPCSGPAPQQVLGGGCGRKGCVTKEGGCAVGVGGCGGRGLCVEVPSAGPFLIGVELELLLGWCVCVLVYVYVCVGICVCTCVLMCVLVYVCVRVRW